jgi:hypothetical protein
VALGPSACRFLCAIRKRSDGIKWLGYQARNLLDNGAVQAGAEQLLMDIAKLEAEKAEKAGKR